MQSKHLLMYAFGSLCGLATATSATDLDLRVESAGIGSITVGPSEVVAYTVVGELTDATNQGLAFFLLDLSLEGGILPPADEPEDGSPLDAFSTPEGINNPEGFGGTPMAGGLRQIGGAQNTINNTFGNAPSGSVTLGIAVPGSPEILVIGSFSAPTLPGTYVLAATNLLASVLRSGETGVPFWAVEPVGVGSVSGLTVEVRALQADVTQLSLSAGGMQTLTLDAGLAGADRMYLLLGSAGGTAPGLPLGSGVSLPLHVLDPYFDFTLLSPNTPPLGNSHGFLDEQGRGQATFALPPGTDSAHTGLVGASLRHAFVLLPDLDFASNPVTCALLL